MHILASLALITLIAQADPHSVCNGEIITTQMNDSERYPGTERSISVYIPEQYDGSRPACMLVRMDGIDSNIPCIIDELIEEGSMPVTIGIFINPGKITKKNGEVLRYNRSNEYDRMTSTWAEFIEYEVIPHIETLSTSDGRHIKISRRSQDRAITGESSGGIAAFNAAWQHPDFYGRVYSIVGTFVPFRGGNNFPVLIRKTEPKPIRIFLQDNDKDSWNLTFGSWYEYNLIMASALEYAGYDHKVHWDKGGHNGNNGRAIMKDVLRYLWADWPEQIETRGTNNELINSILIKGELWNPAFSMPGKPQKEAVFPGGAFIVYEKPHSNTLLASIIDEKGKRSCEEEFYWLHGEGDYNITRNMAFDTEGWLYVTSDTGIQVCDHNGRVRAIISCPSGKIEGMTFVDDTIYVKVNGKCWSRRIRHHATTEDSPAPEPQGQG